MEKISENFTVETVKFDDSQCCDEKLRELMDKISEKHGEHFFGMYMGGGEFLVLKLKDERAMDRKSGNFSKPWRRFDINILHTMILKDMLGIDTTKTDNQCHVEYVKDILGHRIECIRKVRSGECQITFFVNLVNVEDIKEISEHGEIVPQKSTCFYPKVYTGVIIYKFDDS
jgi:uncharacterized protein (DUF1015 family)